MVRRTLLFAMLVPLMACGDDRDRPRVDFARGEDGPDRYAVLSTDGELKMGLTDDYLYFTLSEQTREEARRELRGEAEKGGAEGLVGRVLEKTVGRALDFRFRYPVDEVRDLGWDGDRMRIRFKDPQRDVLRELKVDGRSLLEAFPESAVQAFAEEFRRLKAERAAAAG